MRILNTTIILLLLMIPVIKINAQFKDAEPVKKDDSTKNDPELPGPQNEITCMYEEGFLHISFEREEGVAILSITRISDGSEIASVSFTTACDFTYYIGDITEPIKVEIMSAGGYYTTILY